jgi:hypothetical protein
MVCVTEKEKELRSIVNIDTDIVEMWYLFLLEFFLRFEAEALILFPSFH